MYLALINTYVEYADHLQDLWIAVASCATNTMLGNWITWRYSRVLNLPVMYWDNILILLYGRSIPTQYPYWYGLLNHSNLMLKHCMIVIIECISCTCIVPASFICARYSYIKIHSCLSLFDACYCSSSIPIPLTTKIYWNSQWSIYKIVVLSYSTTTLSAFTSSRVTEWVVLIDHFWVWVHSKMAQWESYQWHVRRF